MPSFAHHGHRIAYREFGSGPRTCVLIHGLLLSGLMHEIGEFLDACWRPARRAGGQRRATAS